VVEEAIRLGCDIKQVCPHLGRIFSPAAGNLSAIARFDSESQ